MTETSQGTKRKTTKTSSFRRHTYGETRLLNPGIKRLITATLAHGEQRRHESCRDEGRVRGGGGVKPAKFLKVRTRERISGGVVTTGTWRAEIEKWNWQATRTRRRMRCMDKGSREEPELMMVTTAWLSQRNSTC